MRRRRKRVATVTAARTVVVVGVDAVGSGRIGFRPHLGPIELGKQNHHRFRYGTGSGDAPQYQGIQLAAVCPERRGAGRQPRRFRGR